jgi:hypothetical protein
MSATFEGLTEDEQVSNLSEQLDTSEEIPNEIKVVPKGMVPRVGELNQRAAHAMRLAEGKPNPRERLPEYAPAVGVISHLEAVKQQIQHGFDITKGPRGSRVSIRAPGH